MPDSFSASSKLETVIVFAVPALDDVKSESLITSEYPALPTVQPVAVSSATSNVFSFSVKLSTVIYVCTSVFSSAQPVIVMSPFVVSPSESVDSPTNAASVGVFSVGVYWVSPIKCKFEKCINSVVMDIICPCTYSEGESIISC